MDKRTTHRFSATTVVAAAAIVALTGCSTSTSTKPSKTTVSPTSATTAAPAPATSASPTTATSPASQPTGSGTPADAATTTAVADAYKRFFTPTNTAAELESSIQGGSQLSAALATQAKNPLASTLSVSVSKVALLNPDAALVTFRLLSKGKPLLPSSPGYAVKENGTWLLAAQTFCALVQLEGPFPAACNDTAVTNLPN
jgi:hypothetical protein